MLLHMLTARQGSLEYLMDLAESQPEGQRADGIRMAKLNADYNELYVELQSRIDTLADATGRLRLWRDLYESCLGWLTNAERRFDNLPLDKEPSATIQKRLGELRVS